MSQNEKLPVASVCASAGMPLTFGSLFAGIGGIDLGFERAGMVCKWQVEIDPYSQKVLAKHWPNVRRHDDIRTWPQPDTERVDVICGGFPCQDISYAGKGAGLTGDRSGLFYELMRVVRDMGPRFVVLENVAALLTRGVDSVLGSLASLWCDAEWHCLPAAAFGAPHIRDRLFIIGSRDRADPDSRGVRVQGRRATEREERGNQEASGQRQRVRADAESVGDDVADATNADRREDGCAATAGGTEHGRQFGGAFGRAIPRDDWWANEPAVGRVADGVPRRVDRLRGLGNAVVPQVAQWIGARIVAAANDADYGATAQGNQTTKVTT